MLTTAPTGGGRAGSCSKNGCSRNAAWVCHRRAHLPGGLCERCVYNKQSEKAGKPGLGASTDVYDARVERESMRRDGPVYVLSCLQSRKPPKIAPNWNTSYRLQRAALVAVVRLGVSGEALSRSHHLQWAEVVATDVKDIRGEGQARSQGRLAVRLLTQADCSTLAAEAELPLESGACVAVIDLRVFVPEVVSVLATFARLAREPQLNHIPFMAHLIGQAPPPAPPMGRLGAAADERAATVIRLAVERSDIDVVARMRPERRTRVAEELCTMTTRANLYGTQLEAFARGISCAVHVTQGPPGTGKSYVGVWIIRALDLFRTEAIKGLLYRIEV